jgi:hypothetical protein
MLKAPNKQQYLKIGSRKRAFNFSHELWKPEDIKAQIVNGKQFLHPYQSFDIGNGLINGDVTAAEMLKYCGISRQNCSKYRQSVKEGVTRHMKAGQPAFVQSNEVQKLQEVFSAKKSYLIRDEGLTGSLTYKQRVIQIINDGRSSKGKNDIANVSPKTLRAIERKANLKHHNCEVGTAARIKACSSIFHVLTFAAANKLHVERMKCLATLGNSDGLSVETTGNKKETKCVIFGVKEEEKNYKVAPDPKNPGENGLLFSAKMMRSGCAAGFEATNVFVLADERMEAEEISVHEVLGLGQGTCAANPGYIVFAKTRCGNKAFYEWYWTSVLLPWFTVLRSSCNLTEKDAFFWTEDGEAVQIEIFKDPAFLAKLKQANVHVAKGGASTTEIEQACDIDNKHKSIKTNILNLNSTNLSLVKTLKHLIREVVRKQENKYIERGKMKSTFLKHASEGLSKLWTAVEMVNRLRTTQHGFIKTGQILEGSDDGEYLKINFLQMVNNLKTDKPISKAMFTTLEEKVLPECVAIMRRCGEITDKKLRDLFVKYNLLYEEDDLDSYIVNRRRTIILTDPAWIDEEIRKEEAKVAAEEERLREKEAAAAEREANRIAAAAAKAEKQLAAERRAEEKRLAAEAKETQKTMKANNPPSNQKRQISQLKEISTQQLSHIEHMQARIAELELLLTQQPPIKKRRVASSAPVEEISCYPPPAPDTPPVLSIMDQSIAEWRRFTEQPTSTSKRAVHIGHFCSSAVCIADNSGCLVDPDSAHRYPPHLQHLCRHRHLCKMCWLGSKACLLCNQAF